jgi:hypothetical protein
MNISPEKIAPSVAFAVVGLVMILVGATGVIPIGTSQPVITALAARIGLVVLGSLLVLLGPILVWREISASRSNREHSLFKKQSKNKAKYGIRIVAPAPGTKFKGGYGNLEVQVAGTYKLKPSDGAKLRLFVKTDEPIVYWRHPAVVEFDEEGHKWYGKIGLWKEKGMQPYSAHIVAAVLDKGGEEAVQHAARMQRETGKNIPFDSLPSHLEKCEDEILVFRV